MGGGRAPLKRAEDAFVSADSNIEDHLFFDGAWDLSVTPAWDFFACGVRGVRDGKENHNIEGLPSWGDNSGV